MASISELTEMFDGMSTAQKKQFIIKLKEQLEGSEVRAHKQFLNECIIKFNAEVQAAFPQKYGDWQQPGLLRPGGFAETFRCYGGSTLFLVGIILFTAGNLANHILPFGLYNLFLLAPQALPIAGFWLIFAASKSSKPSGLQGKALPALVLFKVKIIINLVLACFVPLIALVLSVVAMTGGSVFGIDGVMAVGIILLLLTAGTAVLVIIYYKAVFRVVGGIREGLVKNTVKPLRGLNAFSVLTYIFVGFSILFGVISLLAVSVIGRLIGDIMNYLPSGLYAVMEQIVPSAASVGISLICTAAINVGTVICVVSLSRLNNNLKNKAR